MRITELNTLELAVNEIFDWNGTKVIVKEDVNGSVGCSKCVLRGLRDCRLFECRETFREDETGVYFIKAK